MMEAGVRVGMVDGVTADHYPSRHWTPRWEEDHGGPDYAAPEHPGNGHSDPEWEYVPEGFARARRIGDQAAIGWKAENIAAAYREKWPAFLRAVEGAGPLGVNHELPAGIEPGRDDVLTQNAVLAYAYALARAANGSPTLSVLDWGGALGHYYVFARRLFPSLQLHYHCREVPSVCAVGRSVLPEVTFHEDDRCFEHRYDLVIASNALQYVEDWEQLVAGLGGASAGWMFLTRVPIAKAHESFVALQRAYAYGYGTEYLGWVLNRDSLLAAARSFGLVLEREFSLIDGWEIARAPSDVAQMGFLFRAPGGH
jgi:putative methyltransferase (TIGR04325 family)